MMNCFSDVVNQVTTKNDGEVEYIVDKETPYGGTFEIIKIYGHVLINQDVTILTQNKYQVNGSSLNFVSS